MKAHIEYWILALAVAIAASLTLSGQARLRARQVLLCLVSIFVFAYLIVLLGAEGKLSRAKACIDQAELPLRLEAAVGAGQKHLFAEIERLSDGGRGDGKSPAAAEAAKTSSLKAAERILNTAVPAKDGGDLIDARLAIVLAAENPSREHGRIMTLLSSLSEAKDKKAQETGEALTAMYGDKPLDPQQVKSLAAMLKDGLPGGWYLDTALTDLYRLSGNTEMYRAHLEELDAKHWRLFVRLGYVLGVGLFSCLVGLIVIIVQLALMSRRAKETPGTGAVGIDVPVKSAYIVFVSWFATELVVSYLLHLLMPRIPGSQSEPLTVALITAGSYLLTNIPGLFYIYYFALKPAGLPFWKTLKASLKVGRSGPLWLAASGYFGWCATIPLIFAAGYIATHFFNSQGSDNPVIGQILQAAGASNLGATVLFYLTLGVLAPFCEEMFFRGFIYQALRQRANVPVSMLCSAFLFALMHFDKGGMLMLFTIGMVLAYVFERTRSLIPSMVTHGLWNSGSFTFALVIFGTQ